MITIATPYNHPDLRSHLQRIEYADGTSNCTIAQEIREACAIYGIASSALWVILELPAGSDDAYGIHAFAINADDFLFIHQLNHSVMLIELEYTKSTIIRMAAVDGIIKLYCLPANRRTEADHFANWTATGWQPTQPHHRWLLHCITSQCTTWLRQSFDQLRKNIIQ